MTFEEKLRQELVETREKYYQAKNSFFAIKHGMKPDYVKESPELIRKYKSALGFLLKCLEEKCDAYGVDSK